MDCAILFRCAGDEDLEQIILLSRRILAEKSGSADSFDDAVVGLIEKQIRQGRIIVAMAGARLVGFLRIFDESVLPMECGRVHFASPAVHESFRDAGTDFGLLETAISLVSGFPAHRLTAALPRGSRCIAFLVEEFAFEIYEDEALSAEIPDGVFLRREYNPKEDAVFCCACSDSVLPGETFEEKARWARRNGMPLLFEWRSWLAYSDAAGFVDVGVEVAAIDIAAMNEYHPCHRERSNRQQALSLVEQAVERAAFLGVPWVVTRLNAGDDAADHPAERARDFYELTAYRARSLNVGILIGTNDISFAVEFFTLFENDHCGLMIDLGGDGWAGLPDSDSLGTVCDRVRALRLSSDPFSSGESPGCDLKPSLVCIDSVSDEECLELRNAISARFQGAQGAGRE